MFLTIEDEVFPKCFSCLSGGLLIAKLILDDDNTEGCWLVFLYENISSIHEKLNIIVYILLVDMWVAKVDG